MRENIALALQARQGCLCPLGCAKQQKIAESFVKRLDIRTSDIEKPIQFLSGGNERKALLARWLATDPRIPTHDELTRAIDVGAHAEIIRLIREFCGRGTSRDRVVLADRRHVGELRGAESSPGRIMAAIAQDRNESAGRKAAAA